MEKTRTISLAAEQHVVVFLSVRWSEFRMPVWVKRSAPASSWWTDRRALQRKSKITARARWGTAHFKWSIVSWNHSLLWSSLLTVFFCSFQISHFKIPRYVLFVTSYPLTITGKVLSQTQSSHIPIKSINDRQIRFILLCLWSRHASRLKQMYNQQRLCQSVIHYIRFCCKTRQLHCTTSWKTSFHKIWTHQLFVFLQPTLLYNLVLNSWIRPLWFLCFSRVVTTADMALCLNRPALNALRQEGKGAISLSARTRRAADLSSKQRIR